MVRNQKPTGRAVSVPAGLATGAAFALVWTIAGAMLIAKLVDSEVMKQESIGYGAMVILVSASFSGAMLSYGRIKRQRVQMCLISGGIYFLLLAAMTSLFFGGQFSGAGVTVILVLAGSAAAILPGLHSGGGKSKRRYKIRTS